MTTSLVLAPQPLHQPCPRQPQPTLPSLPLVWSQLEPAQQDQLAQLLAELIQRIRATTPSPEEARHEDRR